MNWYSSVTTLVSRLVRWLRSPRGMMRVSFGVIVVGVCWQAHLVWRQTLVEHMAKRRGDVIERATLIPYWLKQHVPERVVALVEPIVGYRQFGSSGNLTPAEVRQLSRLTYLRNLELVRVAPETWLEVGRLRNLTRLRLGTGCDLRECDFRQIVRLKRLRCLELRWTILDTSAFDMLAEFPSLQDLTIDGPSEWRETYDGNPNGPTRRVQRRVELTPQQLHALASLPNLKRLHLRQLFNFGNEQLITMTEMRPDGRRPFPKLEFLCFEEISVYGPGLSGLRNLPRLRHVDFRGAGLGDEGLAELQHVPGLREMHLRDCSLTPAGAAGFAKLTNLEYLGATRVNIGDEGAIALSSLKHLNHLSFRDANISDEGAAQLTRLKGLTFLELAGNNISHETAIRLGTLPRLKFLILPSGTMPETVAALKVLLPLSCDVSVARDIKPSYIGPFTLPTLPTEPPPQVDEFSIAE